MLWWEEFPLRTLSSSKQHRAKPSTSSFYSVSTLLMTTQISAWAKPSPWTCNWLCSSLRWTYNCFWLLPSAGKPQLTLNIFPCAQWNFSFCNLKLCHKGLLLNGNEASHKAFGAGESISLFLLTLPLEWLTISTVSDCNHASRSYLWEGANTCQCKFAAWSGRLSPGISWSELQFQLALCSKQHNIQQPCSSTLRRHLVLIPGRVRHIFAVGWTNNAFNEYFFPSQCRSAAFLPSYYSSHVLSRHKEQRGLSN